MTGQCQTSCTGDKITINCSFTVLNAGMEPNKRVLKVYSLTSRAEDVATHTALDKTN